MKLNSGTIVDGKYEVMSVLGEGGMGVVYRVTQSALNREIALKMISASVDEAASARARLQREAEVLNKLEHRNIVSFYNFGIWGGFPYVAMQLVRGQTLDSRLLSQERLEQDELISLFLQICQGVAYAHKHGVIHRDLKPANIILSHQNDECVPKVIDFGLVHILPGVCKHYQKLTETGVAVGSILYMSPEQCTGKTIDPRSDIYSLGMILHHCVAGEAMYEQYTYDSVALMKAHLEKPPESLPPGPVPYKPGLQQIIYKAVQKDPKRRYADLDEMIEDLRLVQNNEGDKVVLTHGVIPNGDMAPALRGNNAMSNLSVAVFLVIAIGAGLCYYFSDDYVNAHKINVLRNRIRDEHAVFSTHVADEDEALVPLFLQLGELFQHRKLRHYGPVQVDSDTTIERNNNKSWTAESVETSDALAHDRPLLADSGIKRCILKSTNYDELSTSISYFVTYLIKRSEAKTAESLVQGKYVLDRQLLSLSPSLVLEDDCLLLQCYASLSEAVKAKDICGRILKDPNFAKLPVSEQVTAVGLAADWLPDFSLENYPKMIAFIDSDAMKTYASQSAQSRMRIISILMSLKKTDLVDKTIETWEADPISRAVLFARISRWFLFRGDLHNTNRYAVISLELCDQNSSSKTRAARAMLSEARWISGISLASIAILENNKAQVDSQLRTLANLSPVADNNIVNAAKETLRDDLNQHAMFRETAYLYPNERSTAETLSKIHELAASAEAELEKTLYSPNATKPLSAGALAASRESYRLLRDFAHQESLGKLKYDLTPSEELKSLLIDGHGLQNQIIWLIDTHIMCEEAACNLSLLDGDLKSTVETMISASETSRLPADQHRFNKIAYREELILIANSPQFLRHELRVAAARILPSDKFSCSESTLGAIVNRMRNGESYPDGVAELLSSCLGGLDAKDAAHLLMDKTLATADEKTALELEYTGEFSHSTKLAACKKFTHSESFGKIFADRWYQHALGRPLPPVWEAQPWINRYRGIYALSRSIAEMLSCEEFELHARRLETNALALRTFQQLWDRQPTESEQAMIDRVLMPYLRDLHG